jgi:hypothetical protein
VENNKIDLREIGWEVMDWIDLAQESDKCTAFLNEYLTTVKQSYVVNSK